MQKKKNYSKIKVSGLITTLIFCALIILAVSSEQGEPAAQAKLAVPATEDTAQPISTATDIEEPLSQPVTTITPEPQPNFDCGDSFENWLKELAMCVAEGADISTCRDDNPRQVQTYETFLGYPAGNVCHPDLEYLLPGLSSLPEQMEVIVFVEAQNSTIKATIIEVAYFIENGNKYIFNLDGNCVWPEGCTTTLLEQSGAELSYWLTTTEFNLLQ